jgi:hypothetical protein
MIKMTAKVRLIMIGINIKLKNFFILESTEPQRESLLAHTHSHTNMKKTLFIILGIFALAKLLNLLNHLIIKMESDQIYKSLALSTFHFQN